MKTETKEQLEELAVKRLEEASSADINDENYENTAFKEGMAAIEKLTTLEQQENQKVQQEKELQQKAKDQTISWKDIAGWALKIVEIAAIPIGIAIINNKHDEKQLNKINEFESDGNIYTGTGGRSVGKEIKWK